MATDNYLLDVDPIYPIYVRARTLEKMRPRRETFIETIQRIYDAEGVRRDFRSEFAARYTNRMLRWHRWSEIAGRVRQPSSAR